MTIQPELPASSPPDLKYRESNYQGSKPQGSKPQGSKSQDSKSQSMAESSSTKSVKKICTWDRRVGWVWVPVSNAQAD